MSNFLKKLILKKIIFVKNAEKVTCMPEIKQSKHIEVLGF